jgi:hypothetical protein
MSTVSLNHVPGFDDEGLKTFLTLWRLLSRHLEDGGYMLAGGAAIRFLLANNAPVNDYRLWRRFRSSEYDVIVNQPTGVHTSLFGPGTGFVLLSFRSEASPHSHHQTRYWLVMHLPSGIRFNIYETRDANIQPLNITCRGVEIPVQNLDDQFISILQDAGRPLRKQPVAAKQLADVRYLAHYIAHPTAAPDYATEAVDVSFDVSLTQLWRIRTRNDRTPLGDMSLNQAVATVTRPGYGAGLVVTDPFGPTIGGILRQFLRRGWGPTTRHALYRPVWNPRWIVPYFIRHRLFARQR